MVCVLDGTYGHEHCCDLVRQSFRDAVTRRFGDRLRGDVTISHHRLVSPGFTEAAVRCPHGVLYWAAPDADMQESLKSAR